MQIKLKFTNALAAGSELEHSGDYPGIAEAVSALVGTFSRDFNAANLDFVEVEVDGSSLGDEGLLQAELALKQFYT